MRSLSSPLLTLVLALVGCGGIAVPAGAPPAPDDRIHWGERDEPYPIRLGQLDAVPVNRVRGAGAMRLELGGLYARHFADDEPTDELLLYFRAPHRDEASRPPLPDFLELRIGGEVFRYAPPAGRRMSGTQRDGDEIIDYLLVPVAPALVERLSAATYVVGRLGTACQFEIRRRVLTRLRLLLDVVPPDARFAQLDSPRTGLVLAERQ